jgi:hypothetical protein
LTVCHSLKNLPLQRCGEESTGNTYLPLQEKKDSILLQQKPKGLDMRREKTHQGAPIKNEGH